jgi:hypothetical protein
LGAHLRREEKIFNRGLRDMAQAELLCYKLLGGLAIRWYNHLVLLVASKLPYMLVDAGTAPLDYGVRAYKRSKRCLIFGIVLTSNVFLCNLSRIVYVFYLYHD